MQQSKMLETWVGLFVALGMVGLFFLAMKVSNLGELQSKGNSYKLVARFQNAGSLRERAPVSMAGVRIGRVNSIRFDKETYEAVVEMLIDPQYDTIPTDTTANVLTAGLLGEQYIGLSAGGSDEYLKNGDEVELTQSALVLEEVISRFLFSKAEGGADKKEPAASTGNAGKDVEPDRSIQEEIPPAPAVEPAPAPAAHKPKAEMSAVPAPAHKPKAAAAKPVEHAGHKAEHGKGDKKDEDEPAPAHKPAKAPAKGAAN